MKYYISLINLVILAIFDLIMAYSVKDWTDGIILSMVSTHGIFLIGVGFLLISPSGKNGDLFAASSELFSLVFLLISVIFSVSLLFWEPDSNLIIVINAILIIIYLTFLVFDHSVNKSSSIADAKVSKQMSDFYEVDDNLIKAMRLCKDRTLEKYIEEAYDAAMARTFSDKEGIEEIDLKIFNLSRQILSASTSDDQDMLKQHCDNILELFFMREKLIRNRGA